MSIIFKLFLSLFIPTLLGNAIILFLFRSKPLSRLVSLALGYGLGIGILAQFMFMLGALNLPLRRNLIALPLILVSIVLLYFYFNKRISDKKNFHIKDIQSLFSSDYRSTFITSVLCIICLSYYVFYIFWNTSSVPLFAWDSIATIAFKAKILFYDKSFVHLKTLPHPYYPLQMPLLQTWVALNLNAWNDQWIKIILPFTFLSFLVINYSFLKVLTNRLWALLGSIVLCSSSYFIDLATLATNDFMLLYYNCIAIMLIILWNRQNQEKFLWLAGAFAGMATFTKLEATVYPAIHLTIIFIALLDKKFSWKDRARTMITFIIPCSLFALPFIIYKKTISLAGSGRFALNIGFHVLGRIPPIFNRLVEDLFLMWLWNIIWILFVMCLISTVSRKKTKEFKLLLTALLLFFSLWACVGLFTPNYHNLFINPIGIYNDLPRMILHFYPIVTWLITLCLFSFYHSQDE